jgi:hypothetical protein
MNDIGYMYKQWLKNIFKHKPLFYIGVISLFYIGVISLFILELSPFFILEFFISLFYIGVTSGEITPI